MKTIILFLLSFIGFATVCRAQVYIEPLAGYQLDLNNKYNFKQFNTGVQFSFKKNRHYEFMLQLQKTWPFAVHSGDSSFSPNPDFPLYANAKKAIRPSSFTFATGHRISFIGVKSRNVFSLLFYAGLTWQHIAVAYQYDKSNYTLLNPDQTIDRVGLYLGGGAEYMHLLKTGRIFIQLIVATPPAANKINYPSSFGLMAPLSFNAGYSIMIKKNKHAKK